MGTLRRAGKDHFVKEYTLQYSDDDITWTDYRENAHIKVGSLLIAHEAYTHAQVELRGVYWADQC